jgi:hypothetical protein
MPSQCISTAKSGSSSVIDSMNPETVTFPFQPFPVSYINNTTSTFPVSEIPLAIGATPQDKMVSYESGWNEFLLSLSEWFKLPSSSNS